MPEMKKYKTTPVLKLSAAPGEQESWGRSTAVVYLWALVEILLVTNPLQISSRIRTAALRAFGAKIGRGVIFRPRTQVKFPWKLEIGDDTWIGEGVWIHNQDQLTIGSNVVISQEAFITNGSHRVRTDMGLITRPVVINDGAWICTRAIVLGGCNVGVSAVVSPNSALPANAIVPNGEVWSSPRASKESMRFDDNGIG